MILCTLSLLKVEKSHLFPFSSSELALQERTHCPEARSVMIQKPVVIHFFRICLGLTQADKPFAKKIQQNGGETCFYQNTDHKENKTAQQITDNALTDQFHAERQIPDIGNAEDKVGHIIDVSHVGCHKEQTP